MGKTPFKLKGWSPFTKTSPAKDVIDRVIAEEREKSLWKETGSEKIEPGSEMAKEGYTSKITYTNPLDGGTKIRYE